jgi:hypothetical protein
MLSSAFARSRPLMARYDVSPHMTKWWKAVRPDDGQVRPGVSSDDSRAASVCGHGKFPTLDTEGVGRRLDRPRVTRRGWHRMEIAPSIFFFAGLSG